jgi:hypothetical protein
MAVPGEFKQPIGEAIEPILKGETAILVGTGPSVKTQLKELNNDIPKISINNSYEIIPGLPAAHIACNLDWWEHYWPRSPRLREMPCPKYTWYKEIADRYNKDIQDYNKITYVKAIVKDGLSLDPKILHINHGSGPMGINLALLLGVRKLLLVGHDMKFAKDYNGRRKKAGSKPRHFFGEYPDKLQHWPSVKVGKNGQLNGLIEAYNKMPPDLEKGGMEVINCTPGSALPTFPMSTLEKEI